MPLASGQSQVIYALSLSSLKHSHDINLPGSLCYDMHIAQGSLHEGKANSVPDWSKHEERVSAARFSARLCRQADTGAQGCVHSRVLPYLPAVLNRRDWPAARDPSRHGSC